jgi:hypothetical protein
MERTYATFMSYSCMDAKNPNRKTEGERERESKQMWEVGERIENGND